MKCRIAAAALAASVYVSMVSAQPLATTLKFEVASLKPSPAGGRGGGIRPAPGGERYLATNMPLKSLIITAYRVKADQVAGGPGWIDTDPYDMNAKADKPSSVEELHVMLQNLLADRFKLRFHHETKDLPLYAITVDKDGPKIQAHEAQSAGDPWIDQTVDQIVKVKMTAKFAPLDFFAWRLSMQLDRPVVDQTKLKGGYDFELSFTQNLPPGVKDGDLINGAAIDTSGPTIFEAMRKQLGLKLEAQKGPVDIMVIDHVEKPTGD
jgi:uncharacterized protein (TIGR03435 family)